MGQAIERDENNTLISAEKVRGTTVYDSSGEKIGSIDDIVLTKVSGKVAYAVMSFGGFLGIGEKYHPLPWDALHYDTYLDGYQVGMTGEGFREAPAYSRAELSNHDWWTMTDDYYDNAYRSGTLARSPDYRQGAGL